MAIFLSSIAQRTLAKHPRRELLTEKLEQLAQNAEALANNITRLTGRPESRLRVGDMRVIFERRGDDLIVTAIAARGAVYD